MKLRIACLLLPCVLLVSACKSDLCTPSSVTYVSDAAFLPGLTAVLESTPTDGLFTVQIGRKTVEVDRVIHGPLCNDHWSGTIYVDCDIQIVAWTKEKGSNFLENCNLMIDPGTVVYVAAHNNAPFYKGCDSCHGGMAETPTP